jgi:hypothetical protein
MSGGDRVIRWSTALAVLGAAAVVAVASYGHAYDLAMVSTETGSTPGGVAAIQPATPAVGTAPSGRRGT